MAIKEWFRNLQPYQLYVMVFLTAVFVVAQLVVSHMAHALTLLVDACHMICNLIALSGCIITIQKSSRNSLASWPKVAGDTTPNDDETSADSPCDNHLESSACDRMAIASERRLRNTFGWARIDVLVMLICCVFLASLCFSLVVEALQLLVHIDFHDEMHHAIPVMCVGAAGILLNGICYVMIGGYTFHQGSFLHLTESGDVVLDNKITRDSLRQGQRRLSKQSRRPATRAMQVAPRQGAREMCRDIIGCLFVIVCSVIVYCTDESVAKYVDPIMAIISAVVLLFLSYPYMKESGLILLQTIPDHINMDTIKQKLLKEFPNILNVHEFHVWQLTSTKVISTAHIIFLNQQDYTRITNNITDFFLEQGITHLTIQPEFYRIDSNSILAELPSAEDYECLVSCKEELCEKMHCCSFKDGSLSSISIGHGHSHGHSHHGHGHSHGVHEPKPLTSTKTILAVNEKCDSHETSKPQPLKSTKEIGTLPVNKTCDDHEAPEPQQLTSTKEIITPLVNGKCNSHGANKPQTSTTKETPPVNVKCEELETDAKVFLSEVEAKIPNNQDIVEDIISNNSTVSAK